MSAVAERARVAVLLSDYAAVDAANKINLLGLGWAVTGADPSSGLTAPQTVVVLIDAPPDLYGEDFAVTLTLRNADDEPVELPGPAGAMQAMRIAQNVRVEEPVFAPNLNVPRRAVWAHTQIILNLANGLPLALGQPYTWTLEIDSTQDPRWAVSFFVPGPRSAPVFGGPANPATIPELGHPD